MFRVNVFDCNQFMFLLRLYVLRGKPVEVLPDVLSQWKITHLTFEHDTEPYAKERDEAVAALAKEHGVKITQKVSHTLYDTQR